VKAITPVRNARRLACRVDWAERGNCARRKRVEVAQCGCGNGGLTVTAAEPVSGFGDVRAGDHAGSTFAG
jgi:hypothetical protein